MIRSKFRVNEVVKTEYSETAKLTAVCEDKPGDENTRFNKATPSGSISITIDNPAAQGVLVPGKQFYVDFTPAE
jgi:hypothetical protein